MKFIILLLISNFAFSQAKIVLNQNVFLTIDNQAKIVVANPNANAISVAGTGGNIISENENNNLIWVISNSSGSYSIPWTTKPISRGGNGTKIPLTMEITGAGSANGKFKFSTYETTNDQNNPYPTGVSNLNTGSPAVDGSLNVVDRFWILDNSSYTTKPSARIRFAYNDNASEIAGTNVILESNLQAQAWNTSINGWDNTLYGTADATANTVSGVVVTPAKFWPVWVLVDNKIILPINLISQKVENFNCTNVISWTVSKEYNVNHYLVQKSSDGINWQNIAIQKSNNENTENEITYSVTDKVDAIKSTEYYRIVEVDNDGKNQFFEILAVNSSCMNEQEITVYPNPVQNSLIINSEKDVFIKINDDLGRIIFQDFIKQGINPLDVSAWRDAIYFIQISDNYSTIQTLKFIKIK